MSFFFGFASEIVKLAKDAGVAVEFGKPEIKKTKPVLEFGKPEVKQVKKPSIEFGKPEVK